MEWTFHDHAFKGSDKKVVYQIINERFRLSPRGKVELKKRRHVQTSSLQPASKEHPAFMTPGCLPSSTRFPLMHYF
jgi:hypothetical protein